MTPGALSPPLPPLLPLGWIEPVEIILTGIAVFAALLASGHAVVYKREPRSAALWIVSIWTIPVVGTLLYVLMGINRVERRAVKMRRRMVRRHADRRQPHADVVHALAKAPHLEPLIGLVSQIVPRPLLPGNTVEPLEDGREAFPAMLAAIDEAKVSVGIASYIFDGDGIGADFVEALARAHARGVEVRVLIDDVDARFSRSTAVKPLRRRGVNVGVFNPPIVPARLHAANLRNHRKILVVDGTVGFTGGMNVDLRFWRPDDPAKAFHDLHFRVRGPVVSQLMEVFADDWQFATDEELQGPKWFPSLVSVGHTVARGIEAGPDESHERLSWTIIGALNAARASVQIVTPYFIPDATLISALNAAAMRGVEIDIFLPAQSDLPHVQWAQTAHLWQVLEHDCRVWLTEGPFDHTKLLLVDNTWTLLGSANWDTRSLRLNFEFNVECYCADLGSRVDACIKSRRQRARRITLAEVDRRPLPIKLRDGVARLFAPYL